MDQIQSCLAQVLVSAYTEYWKIWIDYKKWCFETAEQVVSGSSSSSANLTATFTVPTTAYLDLHVCIQIQLSCAFFMLNQNNSQQSTVWKRCENNIFEYTMSPNPTSDFKY
jgi:hypothetical protein